MTIRIRGLPASFGISKPIRRAHDDRVRGDPVVHGREPVPYSGAVHRSTHHRLGTSCRQPQARREPSAVAQGPSTTLSPRSSCAAGGTNRCVCWAVRTRSCVKEKCSFKSKGVVNPVVFRRCVARSSRNCCEEVTGGTARVHHEAAEMPREVAGGACARDLTHAQECPVLSGLPPKGRGGLLGPSMNQNRSTFSNATALTPWTTPSTNARIPRVQCRGRHPVGDAQDDRLRLRAQETLQASTDRRGVGRRSCSTRVTAARSSPFSVTQWNLRVSFISNIFQPVNVTIFVKMAYGRRAATRSPLITFL